MIRGLSEHNHAIAAQEGRTVSDVVVEAMFGAVIRGDWEPRTVFAVRKSSMRFLSGLAMSKVKRSPVVEDENELVDAMRENLDALDKEESIELFENAYANGRTPHGRRR